MQEATEETRARLDMLRILSGRLKMRRVLRALRAHSKQNLIRYPPTNGNFLRFSEVWLRSSFCELMQTVWQEFPKQKLTSNPSSGQPNFMLNYLGLSRVPRYRQFFFIANILLRKHFLSLTFRSL